jgi:hypothetical protein
MQPQEQAPTPLTPACPRSLPLPLTYSAVALACTLTTLYSDPNLPRERHSMDGVMRENSGA